MTILDETRARAPELADALEQIRATPLTFEGEFPVGHSRDNHVHLHCLEYAADDYPWVDLDYRVRFVRDILHHWRGRLKGLRPYRHQGYRVYLYEDMAPTLTVVAAMDAWPMFEPAPNCTFHEHPEDIMRLYVGRSWRERWVVDPVTIPTERILDTIEKHTGSIGRPTAEALGVNLAEVRKLIAKRGIAAEVNSIRKRHKRATAKIHDYECADPPDHVWEQVWPAGYR